MAVRLGLLVQAMQALAAGLRLAAAHYRDRTLQPTPQVRNGQYRLAHIPTHPPPPYILTHIPSYSPPARHPLYLHIFLLTPLPPYILTHIATHHPTTLCISPPSVITHTHTYTDPTHYPLYSYAFLFTTLVITYETFLYKLEFSGFSFFVVNAPSLVAFALAKKTNEPDIEM